MTEEEKKAVEDCKEFIEYLKNSGGLYYRGISIKKIIEILLNLIEKLQKENEELNNRDTSRLSEIGRLRTKNNHLENEIKYYYIPKDEIEKIKSKNIGQYMNFYREIEELLEEE